MSSCLVVDDSSIIRKVARRILEGFDLEVSEAEDGVEGIELCRRRMPDFILLDSDLPAMDGLEFLARLRAMENGSHAKVVYCTSELDVALITRAHRAGADEYMLKPFDRTSIEAKLHEIGAI